MMKEKYVVIDTETTGNVPERGDKIIQIGLSVVENNKIVDKYATYVHPKREIPSFIQELTGITPEDVETAPIFEEIAPTIHDYLKDSYFVAHHVDFDISFINRELKRAGYPPFTGPIIDTVECARILFPTFDSYQLNRLASAFHIPHNRPHQADSDAETTAHLWIHFMKKITELPKETVQKMLKLLKYIDSDIEHLFVRSLRENTEKQAAVVFQGLALKPYSNDRDDDMSNEEIKEENEALLSSVTHVLGTEWETYEEREGQEKMAQLMSEAFHQHRHLFIEAPAGIGKTFAYLIPSLAYAIRTNKQVIVSTQTIALQEQLMTKDIPILTKLFPIPFRVVPLKGKSHYVSLRKIKQLTSGPLASYEEALGLLQVLVWLLETDTGDIKEINIAGGKQNTLMEKIVCDDTIYSPVSEPWREVEYYFRVRKQAQHAHLIIVNHALLLNEFAHRDSFLSEVTHVVIDEAHHIERVASETFGTYIDYFQMKRLFNRFDILTSTGYFSSLFFYEQERVMHFHPSWYEERKDHLTLLTYELDELFRALHQFTILQQKTSGPQDRKRTVSFRPNEESSKRWKHAQASLQRFLAIIASELDDWYTFTNVLDDAMEQNGSQRNVLQDFHSFLQQIERKADTLYSLLTEEEGNYVYFLEADVGAAGNACAISKRPIDVGEVLANTLFQRFDSAILLSSSFTVDHSFLYVKQVLGLEDFMPETFTFPSPYSYRNQAKLYVPTDIEFIAEEDRFIEDISEFLFHTTSVVDGRILVLFTSLDMVQKTYEHIKTWEEASDFTFLVQGERRRGKEKLLKLFRQEERSVLLGTNTFMEGVDIPSVKAVLLVRLPFSSPEEPLLKAKLEKMKAEGKNAFKELSLPEAVLRFKQAFGRLIRKKTDRGVFIVLDRRVIEKDYGKYFLRSLPDVPIERLPMEETFYSLVDFFKGEERGK